MGTPSWAQSLSWRNVLFSDSEKLVHITHSSALGSQNFSSYPSEHHRQLNLETLCPYKQMEVKSYLGLLSELKWQLSDFSSLESQPQIYKISFAGTYLSSHEPCIMNSDTFPMTDSGKKNPIDSCKAHFLRSARWILDCLWRGTLISKHFFSEASK